MTTAGSKDALPSFNKPPVSEVVFGLQFKPLTEMLAAHTGRFWQRIRESYPDATEAALLATPIERFGDDLVYEEPIDLSEILKVPRMWFQSSSGTELIQLQRNHFIHNWRKRSDGDIYPRYPTLKEAFRERLGDFRSFVDEFNLGEIVPLQYELTYSNIIPYNDLAKGIGELGNIFTGVNSEHNEDRFLPAPMGFNWLTVYTFENNTGRLRASITEIVNSKTKESAIKFELTVRGISEDTSDSAMWEWFATAREWIVRGFCDMTTSTFQAKVWERTE